MYSCIIAYHVNYWLLYWQINGWISYILFILMIIIFIIYHYIIFINSLFYLHSCHSNERLFLRDLVTCAPGTSGGRLTRWLQPESFVDPGRCELLYAREEMRCGWPAQLTVLTKDQYGDTVHVPNLKVSIFTFLL